MIAVRKHAAIPTLPIINIYDAGVKCNKNIKFGYERGETMLNAQYSMPGGGAASPIAA
jgi:hypothetical protein